MPEGLTTTPSRAAGLAVRVMLGLYALVSSVALFQLAACGGSGSDEPDKSIDPLVCLHRPQVCK